jgi:uncharacterized protein YhfF
LSSKDEFRRSPSATRKRLSASPSYNSENESDSSDSEGELVIVLTSSGEGSTIVSKKRRCATPSECA